MRRRSRSGILIAALFLPATALAASPFSSALVEMGLDFKDAPAYGLETAGRWGDWPHEGSQWTVTTASGTPKLRLQAYAEVSAPAARSKEELQLRRLRFFYARDAAYPGMKPSRYTPPPQLVPKIIPAGRSGHAAAIVSVPSRLTYGNAREDLVVYRGVLTFLYCPASRRFFQLEVFYPKDDFTKDGALRDAARFSCAP